MAHHGFMTDSENRSWFLSWFREPSVGAAWIFLFALLAFHWVLPLDFTGFDSGPLIQANRLDEGHPPWKCFAHEVRDSIEPSVAFYRPWTGFSYGLNHALFGLNARSYQGVDLFLHASTAVALFLFLMALGMPAWAALLGGVWFAVHPLGVEVVPAVARRADLWVTLFLLLACWAWLPVMEGKRGAWIVLLVGAGLFAPLSKETGVALPFLLWALAGKGWRLRALGFGLLLVAPALLARTFVLHGIGGYGGWTLDFSPLPAGLGDLLDPARLAGRWPVRIGLPLILVVCLLRSILSRSEGFREPATARSCRFGLVWIVVLLAPAAFARGLSPWYLYTPLAGMAVILAALLGGSIGRVGGSGGKASGSSEKVFRSRHVAVGLLTLAAMIPAFLTSPLVFPGREWNEVSRQMGIWRQVIRQLPPEYFNGPQLVAGLPFRVEDRFLRYGGVRSASCLSDFSLRAWTRLLTGRDSDPHAAAFVKILRPASRYSMQVSWLPKCGEVRIHSSGPVQLLLDFDDPLFTRLEPRGDEIRIEDLRAPLWRFDGRKLVKVEVPWAR